MKTTVKTFWICMLLMLTTSISGFAIDFAKVDSKLLVHEGANVSASFSSCSATSNVEDANSTFTLAKLLWLSDVELGTKPVSEVYSSNPQRLRRVLEENLFLRNILLILSNHENLLVQGQTKLYYSDANPYSLLGSAYYVYTLRRILI